MLTPPPLPPPTPPFFRWPPYMNYSLFLPENLDHPPSTVFWKSQPPIHKGGFMLWKHFACVAKNVYQQKELILSTLKEFYQTFETTYFYNKSSSAAELAASLDPLGPHGSVQVLTITSHHQLQNLLPHRSWWWWLDIELDIYDLIQTWYSHHQMQLMMTCYF